MLEIFGQQTPTARRWSDGRPVEVAIADLRVDDVVVVLSGERIPVDGEVVEGEALIDQSVLTGEYAPVDRGPGQQVFAMTALLAGRLHIRVVRSGESTNAAKIRQIVEQSLEHRVRLQSRSERFAQKMVYPTFLLGAAGYVTAGPNAMMGILNADYGTGIRIAGPLAMLSSISTALRRGILVKDGSVLEGLCQVDAIVFDKTGTLTVETPEVRQVVSFDPRYDERQLLTFVASAEQLFHHPIARAVLREAKARGLRLPPMDHASLRIGMGVEVETAAGHLRVGSRRYLESQGIAFDAAQGELTGEIHARGGSSLFASLDDRLLGLVELAASARPEAYDVIRGLREERGIREIHLISGDHEAPTAQLASQLGIDRYFHEVLPHEKVEHIRRLQARGLRVAMVGDGVNDSAALCQADYGISLRGGADAAIDAADIVLMDGELGNLDLLLRISENLTGNIRTSVRLIFIPNSLLIGGALLGAFGLGFSVFLNNAFNLAATLNGLRAQAALKTGEGTITIMS